MPKGIIIFPETREEEVVKRLIKEYTDKGLDIPEELI